MNSRRTFNLDNYLTQTCKRVDAALDHGLRYPDMRAFARKLALAASADEKAPTTFDFEHDAPGGEPHGFEYGRTGEGRPGKWVVRAMEGATSGTHALVQTDADDTDGGAGRALKAGASAGCGVHEHGLPGRSQHWR